jgi:hypothetical protein
MAFVSSTQGGSDGMPATHPERDEPVAAAPAEVSGDRSAEVLSAELEDAEDLPPTGPRRILIALYAIFALAATARAIVQICTVYATAPLAYLLSLFSGVVYIAATVGLLTRRSFSRPLAWAACGTELVGVLTVGTLSLLDRAAFPHDTVWSRFGSGYGYFPVLLPVLGLLYLRYSSSQTADRDGTTSG